MISVMQRVRAGDDDEGYYEYVCALVRASCVRKVRTAVAKRARARTGALLSYVRVFERARRRLSRTAATQPPHTFDNANLC